MGIIVRFFMFTYAALGLGIAVGTLLVATQALDLQFIYQQLNNYIGRWELILTATIWSILSLSLLIIAIWGKHDKEC